LLKSSPRTPKELAEQTGVALNNVSNYLATLRELGLVKCLNKDLKKERVYALTDKGKEIHGALISNIPVVVSD
jgi:DNA-binding transcriptional ArsR family regulator